MKRFNRFEEITANNEDQINDLEKRKVVLDSALALYNKLLSIYQNQYDKLNKICLKTYLLI